MKLKMRLTVMNFLEYAVWGAYLTSMGSYLVKIGMAENIGWFYSVQGIVSLFMPALIGIIADRWMQGQKVLSLCHFLAGVFMLGASLYGFEAGAEASFSTLFTLYSLSVAFFMPTIALANSVAYSALEGAGLDTVKDFPPIRVFGTVGFICSMWAVDLGGMQENAGQFAFSGVLSLLLAAYALTLPVCPVSHVAERKSVVETLGFVPLRCSGKSVWPCFSSFPCVWASVCRSPTVLPVPSSSLSGGFPNMRIRSGYNMPIS